jgi:hypothetical protein
VVGTAASRRGTWLEAKASGPSRSSISTLERRLGFKSLARRRDTAPDVFLLGTSLEDAGDRSAGFALLRTSTVIAKV